MNVHYSDCRNCQDASNLSSQGRKAGFRTLDPALIIDRRRRFVQAQELDRYVLSHLSIAVDHHWRKLELIAHIDDYFADQGVVGIQNDI